jgi:hypothetical protein
MPERSVCPSCGARGRGLDLVPGDLVATVVGKCRHCGMPTHEFTRDRLGRHWERTCEGPVRSPRRMPAETIVTFEVEVTVVETVTVVSAG